MRCYSVTSDAPAETRFCWGCNQFVPLSVVAQGSRGVCKPCKARRKRTIFLFAPEIRFAAQERTKVWLAQNPGYSKAYGRMRRYRMSVEEYWSLFAEQGGRCALCGLPPGGDEEFVVDHDHNCCPSFRTNTRPGCGKCVRGLLHTYCNKVEGMVSDRILAGLIAYRERFPAKVVSSDSPSVSYPS